MNEERELIKLGLPHYRSLHIIHRIWLKQIISMDNNKHRSYGIYDKGSSDFFGDFRLLRLFCYWPEVINCFIYKMEVLEKINFLHRN